MWAIAEMCDRTGLSPRTIRYYEEIGLLPGVRRRASGRRVYGPEELERLGFINRLKALGLSLAEIGELNAVYAIGGSTSAMLARLGLLLTAHLEDVDRRIDALAALRGELLRYGQHIEERIEQDAGAGADPATTGHADTADVERREA
jgi:DNA-binding transcriptional MerR regulator